MIPSIAIALLILPSLHMMNHLCLNSMLFVSIWFCENEYIFLFLLFVIQSGTYPLGSGSDQVSSSNTTLLLVFNPVNFLEQYATLVDLHYVV
jgi:hypothetical protein